MDILKALFKISELYGKSNSAQSIRESMKLEGDYNELISEMKRDMIMTYDELPHFCPFLLPSQIEDLELPMNESESKWLDRYKATCFVGEDNLSYISALREAYFNYHMNKTEDNEKALLKLGWVPSVPLDSEVFERNRNNLYEHIKENFCKIVDVTETVKEMKVKDMKDEYANNTGQRLYPVYIVCSYTYTAFGKVVRAVLADKWSHSSIAFDHTLKNLYSYNMNAKREGGLSFESIDGYIKDNNGAQIHVMVTFLTKQQYEKLRGNLDWYIANWKNSSYSISNLFNIVANKTKTTNHNLNLICSQFVDHLFKLVHLDFTNKPSNLVVPEDLAIIRNPTVYKVYEGLAKDYDPNKVKKFVDKLSKVAAPARSTIKESTVYTDSVIEEMYSIMNNILHPDSIFTEVHVPIRFSEKGDLNIETYKSYEVRYQEIHNLLKTKLSLESRKEEVSKLWYINCKLTKKIQKIKKKKVSDSNKAVLDNYIKLRARVLNDFHSNMKDIMNEDPEFNFSKYYKYGDYNDGVIQVDKNTLSGVGNVIQNIKNLL